MMLLVKVELLIILKILLAIFLSSVENTQSLSKLEASKLKYISHT